MTDIRHETCVLSDAKYHYIELAMKKKKKQNPSI